jgi:3',5'-nucleoside bisphosphate phosphatase
MNWYKADMHIHSVLSPCGDLDMSPAKIVSKAIHNGLDMIAITDHNSTLHAPLMVELGIQNGLTVIPGAEITSAEEVHCLCYFETLDKTAEFQEFINQHSCSIPNDPQRFGMQILVNKDEEILDEIPDLLIVSLNASIDEVEQKVHELGGIFIPAHIDRQANGLMAQIGFLPINLPVDALEFDSSHDSSALLRKYPALHTKTLIANSDAHYIDDIGSHTTEYLLEKPSFTEWKMSLKKENNRTYRIK